MNTRTRLNRIRDDWQTVRPELDTAPMRRCILLRRAATALADGIERVQLAHNLNHALSDLLLTLYRSAPPQGLTPGELSELSAIAPGSMTHRIDRLEAAGLVRRHPDPADARARRVSLTAAGRARVEALLPDHLANERRLLAGLSETEQMQLEQLLLKLTAHLEELPAP